MASIRVGSSALLLLALMAAAAISIDASIIAPVNADVNVRCCGTSGNCVDTDNQCNPVGANSCCKIKTTLAKGTKVNALCYVPGQSIYGDTRWLVITSPVSGYVSDYYVSCGGLCPVPACN